MAASTLKVKTADGHGSGLTAKAYTRDTDTLAANGTSSASTEGTNQKGTYTFTFTGLATGVYDLRITTAADLTVASGLLNHTNAVGVEYPFLDLSGTTVGGISGGGTGARSVTVTVQTAGAVAIQGALVRMTKGAESFVQTTNASGQCTFNLNDGTWTVAITAVGYSFAGTTLVVDGTETPTYTMTANSIAAPASPSSTTGVLITLGIDNQPLSGVEMFFRVHTGPGTAGYSHPTQWFDVTSIAGGVLSYNGFARLTKYVGKRGENGEEHAFTTPDADSFDIPEILGHP